MHSNGPLPQVYYWIVWSHAHQLSVHAGPGAQRLQEHSCQYSPHSQRQADKLVNFKMKYKELVFKENKLHLHILCYLDTLNWLQ